MADDRKRRRRRRPSETSPEVEDRVATDEFPARPIQAELERRGLAEVETDEEEDSATDAEAFVFGGDAPDDSGPTFVGNLPDPADAAAAAGSREKTELLPLHPGEPAPAYPILTIETADGVSEVEIAGDHCILGRSPDCDVVIPDQLVSRQHAIVEQRSDGWYVVDQKSGNGTFLNDERITEAKLFDGDVIYVGDAAVTYGAPGGPEEQARRGLDRTTMLPVSGGTEVTSGPRKRGSRRRRFLMIAGVLVVIIGVLGIIKQLTKKPPEPEGPTPEQIAEMERQRRIEEAEGLFARVKDLAREEKWMEAKPLLDKAGVEIGDRKEYLQYKEYIDREVEAEKAILEARAKMAVEDFEAAMAALVKVSAKSTKAETVLQLKKEIEQQQATTKLENARKALDAKDFETAVRLADELLVANADNQAATELKRMAEAKLNPQPRPPRGKRKRKVVSAPTPPPSNMLLLGASLSSYREGDLAQAMKLAEPEGVTPSGIDQLRKFTRLYEKGKELSRNTGQARQAIDALGQALKLDKRLGGGKGKFTEDIQSKLGKVHFVKGVDAQTMQKYPEAFQQYNLALKYRPDLKQAQERLNVLEKEAQRLFETAYVVKSSDPEKALKLCKTVVQMVRKDAYAYGRCKKVIQKLSLPAGSGSTTEDEGF